MLTNQAGKMGSNKSTTVSADSRSHRKKKEDHKRSVSHELGGSKDMQDVAFIGVQKPTQIMSQD